MSSDNGNNNGAENGAAKAAALPRITITITDRAMFTVGVTGEFPSLDYALNMLDQAKRELEAQWRLQRAALYQQQQIAMAQEAAIRADLRRGN